MEHSITIRTGVNELAATLHYPTGSARETAERCGRWPVLIVCHGFIGSRIGVNRLFVKAARRFSAQGFLTLRFDYGGCGESTGDYGAGGLDALIDETRSVLDYACSLDCVDLSRVTLIGHSLGGAVAALTAVRDHRVKSLALWSAVAHPHYDIVRIVGKEQYARAKPGQPVDHQGYLLTSGFFDSMAMQHPLEQLRKFTGDVLLVHGKADEFVPVDYAPLYRQTLWQRNGGQCDMVLVDDADHTYSSDSACRHLLETTADWLAGMEKRKRDWNDWTI
ncbi:permease [Gordoniibacillus kamchatkensis]|uniref:Permease n=1 Tax=Gordoniibacillus kamchatkensis TaxID=1590651 RepID=A0ABR5AGK4_9BACL|nr:alpha/beta hydrolase [Paenibacillus sp. VKM B-2647]KIL40186.1 permease [Paenibacillus sp. VKM B-2647]